MTHDTRERLDCNVRDLPESMAWLRNDAWRKERRCFPDPPEVEADADDCNGDPDADYVATESFTHRHRDPFTRLWQSCRAQAISPQGQQGQPTRGNVATTIALRVAT